MLTRIPFLVVAALSLGFAPAPRARPNNGSTDLQKMQGVWVPITSSTGNQPDLALRMAISGDRLTYTRAGKIICEYTLTLDASRTPHAYESKGVGGVNLGVSFSGIYSVNGDTLKFCYNGKDNRPAAFEGPNKGSFLEVYQRVKP